MSRLNSQVLAKDFVFSA